MTPKHQQPRPLIGSDAEVRRLKAESLELTSIDLSPHQVCDLELLLNGAFSPLKGYLGQEDFVAVCQSMRLTNGQLWPIPISLDVPEALANSISKDERLALRHPEGMVLAILTVADIWRSNFNREAQEIYGTTDDSHPGVQELFHRTHPYNLGGRLEGLELPPHHTFKHIRHTPSELRSAFQANGWKEVVAFQTRNPLHRAHVELTKRAAEETGANLLLHPVVGRTSPGDLDYFVRVRCYEAVLAHYPEQSTRLSLLPLAMRMAGPREALWHALIRRNYGATHFIVGRDHAGARDTAGKPFYKPDAASKLCKRHEDELGIEIVEFEEMVYDGNAGKYLPRSKVRKDHRILSLSGTELRHHLRRGIEIPEWFSYPEVISALRRIHPPRSKQGFTLFFTGLSGSGKSTIAQTLMAMLMELGSRPVTLLDGDIVRKNLSSELGFSKEHRDLNIRRIGYVASEITKNRGTAICAPIAPYRAIRREVRELISHYGGFIEVYVSTPLKVCENRDRKGLYAKARAGLIKEFTGIDDPYEVPENPEITIDTAEVTPDEAAHQIVVYLVRDGWTTSEKIGGYHATSK